MSRTRESPPEVDEPWDPWSLAEVQTRLGAARVRWWVTGGWALALHAGRSWRTHADIDVGIVRADLPHVAALLGDCSLWVAAAGALSAYAGQPLRGDAHQNNVWVRADGRWRLDIQLGDGDAHGWRYRRDPALGRAWAQTVLHTPSGIAYLAPDLQLLFKSRNVRPKDTLDALQVAPLLDAAQRAFLQRQLASAHPWQALL